MGHGPRGLQPGRHGLGSAQPRRRPQPRLSLGRGRHLLGISDDQQILCFALALWNGRDPILKERLFGLTNSEGNHGEDVKECYYYLDATPTHSYLKMLYKYPQRPFPYAQLVEENRRRGKDEPEFELIDTGVFDDDRYFDVFVEYAKSSPSDILIRITVHNRGPEAADLHLLPQLWFRNTWSWGDPVRKPELTLDGDVVVARERARWAPTGCIATATRRGSSRENETNGRRLFGAPEPGGHFKDAFHEYVVDGNAQRRQPASSAAPRPPRTIVSSVPAGGHAVVRLRLSADTHRRSVRRLRRG